VSALERPVGNRAITTPAHLPPIIPWLDVSGETVPSVAGWGEDRALEAVTDFAKTIDELARRIESALQEALDRALVAVQLGARRWAAVPQDREDAGVGGDRGDCFTTKEPP
jgi:hypothetical protein